MADPSLEELFARLKSAPSQAMPVDSATYQPPAVSSPILSPPARGTPPVHSTDIISPVSGTPVPDPRTNNLLNLLKFNGGAPQLPSSSGNPAGSRPQSVTDLVSSLQRNPSGSTAQNASAAAGPDTAAAQKLNLLNLLNRPKEMGSSSPRNNPPTAFSPISTENTIEKLANSFAELPVPSPPSKATIFSHVNPFDQLHASSPLNRTPNPEAPGTPKKIEILKHSRDPSSTSGQTSGTPATKVAKTSSNEQDTTTLPSGPSEETRQSVSEALGGVGEQVDRQVEQALAKAGMDKTPSAQARSSAAIDAADAAKKNTNDNNDVESSWESAEDDEHDDAEVTVYNFPMKPFVCIQINGVEARKPIRQGDFMMVATLKKEFDQVDRCLVTATQTYIGYAQLATKKDNGGLRLIRQDTGDHKQLFRSSGERVFNVQFCSTTGTDVETILGTGVNGSVFWTSLAKSRSDLFVDDDVEAHGFILPAIATVEEQTSGSPVKTRAKMSSRHPDFFAIARGKHIYIIAPDTVKRREYCDPKTHKVSTEKLFAEHSLTISTGKAGKDFCFSEDDSVIVSLDKSGRLKFWDIRDLSRRACDFSETKHDPVELSEPIWTFTAAASDTKPDEKPSVSSVMFIDKEKPTVKGSALRYLIIGFKQNHILQLYDLALKKAVQEVRLPHEKDSDGFCSITYHPRTGVIAVGHPTRNSIYFIHLSAPRYNFGAMEQAKFITLLAKGESSGLPKPDSTAIMSGVRELSFSKVGDLRSLDMLRYPVEEAPNDDSDDETLFELYCMHSKGVTGVSIKRKDLGWNKNNGMLRPADAIESGVASVRPMDATTSQAPSEQNSNSETSSQPTPVKKSESSKSAFSTPVKKEPSAMQNGSSRSIADRTLKQSIDSNRAAQAPVASSSLATPDSYAMAAQRNKTPTKEKGVVDASSSVSKVASATNLGNAPQSSTGNDLRAALESQFDSLYQRIDSDRRVQDAAGAAKQDAMLRLVSSTLTENVEKSLNRIVSASIEKEIIPSLSQITSKSIEKKLADSVPQQLQNTVAKELKMALPGAVQQALKDAHVYNAITEHVGNKINQQLSTLLQQSLPKLATEAAQKLVRETDNRVNAQFREVESRRQQDNDKILELSNLVRALSQTIQTMSDNQAAFQEEIMKIQQLSGTSNVVEEASTTVPATSPPAATEDSEVTKITKLLVDGQYDQATIEWLQSVRQGELFDEIFIRVNPEYLNHVSPIVALSVSAAVTASFDTNIDKRLEWLSTVLVNMNLQDSDIHEVAPKIMDVLSQRLQGTYMQISEANPSDPVLRQIAALNRQVNEVRRVFG